MTIRHTIQRHTLQRSTPRRHTPRRHMLQRLAALGMVACLAATPGALSGTPAAFADPTTTVTVTGSNTDATSERESALLAGLSEVPDPLPDALQITIDEITPQIVNADSDNQVTIQGTLRNVGRLPVSDIQLRIQRGDYVRFGDQLRHVLVEDELNYDTPLPFRSIDKTLKPGEETSYTLTAKISGKGSNSLKINGPGAYPILVNVNGRVNNSDPARLHDARTLLAVHQLPRAAGKGNPSVDGATKAPRPFTLLWPIADIPREAAYYSFSSSLVLRDRALEESLDKEGRLRVLLDAAATMFKDPKLRKSMCLAVDPDLIRTVNRMSFGYRVLDNPREPTGGSSPGKNTGHASDWLDELREIAKGNCLIALPWSGASLGAAAMANQPHPIATLMQDSRRFVSTLLGTPVTNNIIWPTTGMVTRADLRAADHTQFIVAGNAFLTKGVTANGNRSVKNPLRTKVPRHGIRVIMGDRSFTGLPFDTTLATALAGTGNYPENTVYSMPDTRYVLSADSTEARMQDAVTTLLWKVSAAMRRETAQTNSYGHMPLLVAPPQRWTVTAENMQEFVDALKYLAEQQLIAPTSLDDAVQAANVQPFVGRINTRQLETLPTPEPALATIKHGIKGILEHEDLYASSEGEGSDNFLYKRGRYNIYRATSTGPTGATPQLALTTQGVLTLVDPVSRNYPLSYARSIGSAADSITEAVTLITPGNIYTLASTDSSLVLVARNQLPLAVNAVISATDERGQPVSSPQKVVIPAHSSINVHLAVQLPGGEPVPIKLAMRSPSGQILGRDINMEVRASKITPAIGTIFFVAALLLAFLIGKQVLPLIRKRPQKRKKYRKPKQGKQRPQQAERTQRAPQAERPQQAERAQRRPDGNTRFGNKSRRRPHPKSSEHGTLDSDHGD